MADGEDELEAVEVRHDIPSLNFSRLLLSLSLGRDSRLSERRRRLEFRLRHPPLQALYLTGEKRPSLLSGKSIVACKLFDFVFEAFPRLHRAKTHTESGKLSLSIKKESSSRHVCLHTTNQSRAQHSANLQHFSCCKTIWSRTQ